MATHRQRIGSRGRVDGNVCDAIVIFGGGSVLTKPDNIQQALERMFDARVDGFGEAFRRLAWDEWGQVAILARAIAGIVNGCIVFAVPGSTDAVRLGVTKLILPVLPQVLGPAPGMGRGSP